MVLSSTDRLTAIEYAKRNSFNDDQRRIIEEIQVTNEMLLDAPVEEANGLIAHTMLKRTVNPRGQHRNINEGIKTAASQTKTVTDVICQVAAYSEVDKKLVDRAVNPKQFLMDECASFIHGMGEDMADDIIYGNHSKDPAYMDGFAVRRNKLDDLCVSMGGSGSNLTSIYIVKWGRQFAKYIYPKGSKGMGVHREDRGVQDIQAPDGKGKMPAYVNYFEAEYGLTMGYENSLIRLCNIDPSNVNAEELVKTILKLRSRLAKGDGTISILCNSEIMGLMDAATVDKNNVIYTAQDPWGRELNKIRDMRLRQCDAIINTESVVTK
ncbi:MAG: hypothetical protein MJ052_01430 [Sphaerochaetaceae bacterium]|nr:hypothetical protein [Sphaerochaetaceae bacterium]